MVFPSGKTRLTGIAAVIQALRFLTIVFVALYKITFCFLRLWRGFSCSLLSWLTGLHFSSFFESDVSPVCEWVWQRSLKYVKRQRLPEYSDAYKTHWRIPSSQKPGYHPGADDILVRLFCCTIPATVIRIPFFRTLDRSGMGIYSEIPSSSSR